jgi:hypothetical protein
MTDFEKVGWLGPYGFRQQEKSAQRDVALSALNRAYIGAVQPGPVGQFLL